MCCCCCCCALYRCTIGNSRIESPLPLHPILSPYHYAPKHADTQQKKFTYKFIFAKRTNCTIIHSICRIVSLSDVLFSHSQCQKQQPDKIICISYCDAGYINAIKLVSKLRDKWNKRKICRKQNNVFLSTNFCGRKLKLSTTTLVRYAYLPFFPPYLYLSFSLPLTLSHSLILILSFMLSALLIPFPFF